MGNNGFVPYPNTYQYFLDDLWYFNFTSGYWTEVTYPKDMVKPQARSEMLFLLTPELIFMHGGYGDNYLFDDVWYFDLKTHLWLEKKEFVYPKYSLNCSDDFEYIEENNCTHLLWPKHIQRDVNPPFDIIPYGGDGVNFQPWFYPDLATERNVWGIFDKGSLPGPGEFEWSDRPVHGMPMVPFAASGPLQYVKEYEYQFNATNSGILYERCTSVFAQPTRGKVCSVM